MTVSTLTLRQTKGARLTTVEMDNNWLYCSDASNASFIQSGTGAIADDTQSRGRQVLYVRDFLSTTDKASWSAGTEVDVSTALQAAIDTLGDTSVNSRAGVDIYLSGPGILSATITIQKKGVRIVGNGWGNRSDTGFRRTYLRWNGSAGIPMLKFIDCWQPAGVYRLKLMGLTTAKPSAAIEVNNSNTGVTNQQNCFEQVYIGGFSSETDVGTQFTDGIVWTGTNNNAEHRIQHLYVTGCSGYAVKQNSTQNVNVKIDHFTSLTNGTGMYVCGTIQGSNWNFAGSTAADIEIPRLDAAGSQVNPIVFCENYYSESAARMLTVAAGSAYTVTLSGQFQITSSLNADGKIILDEGTTFGQLRLQDFRFTQASAPAGSPQLSMRSGVGGASRRIIVLDNIQGWTYMTGGTDGLNVATRAATDTTYIFYRENTQGPSANAARLAQNFLVGVGADWDATRFDTPNLGVPTGGSTTISTGVGSVKMSSANAATNASWIPIKYAGTTYYVPGWTTNSP